MATGVAVYRITARNTATSSANKIHDDEVARSYGFSGGLVPGVTVFAYMARPPAERFGLDFLERGAISARFVLPVYNGETISVALGADGVVEVTNPAGGVCAVGTATIAEAVDELDVGRYPEAPLPSTVPRASPEAFAAAPILGTVKGSLTAESRRAYLDLISDDSPLYEEQKAAHPGWLLSWANLALTSNVRMGPWIHTSSEVRFLSVVRDGEGVSARALTVGTYERKGHNFVELDVLLIAGEGRPVMKARHVAIYEPRRPG